MCLAEKGWEGIRSLTLSLKDCNIASVCVIKGELEQDVIDNITKYKLIGLMPISRSIFKVYTTLIILKNFFVRNLICIIVDNKKNYCWVSNLGKISSLQTLFLAEQNHSYALSLDKEQKDIEFIMELAKKIK